MQWSVIITAMLYMYMYIHSQVVRELHIHCLNGANQLHRAINISEPHNSHTFHSHGMTAKLS